MRLSQRQKCCKIYIISFFKTFKRGHNYFSKHFSSFIMQAIIQLVVLLLLFQLFLQPFVLAESTCDCSKSSNCSSLKFKDCAQKNCNEEKYVVCHFTNWAWYRNAPANFKPENINASLCTHIFYAFSSLDPSTLLMVPSDPWADIDNKHFELVTAFKQKGLKVFLSIGGWNNSGGSHWSKMFNNATARAEFVKGVLAFLKKYNFDGLCVNNEYPACPQGNFTAGIATDKKNFNVLLYELKKIFNGKFSLTITTAAGKTIIEKCYDMAEICHLADWIVVMGYDYHVSSDNETGANGPICGIGNTWGVYQTIWHYVKVLKCPPKKIVLGIGLYGQSFQLEDSTKPKFGVASKGPGEAGPYTNNPGTMAYYEICLKLKNGWKSVFTKTSGSIAYNGDQFVSYDSKIDIIKKCCLINKHFNLKGAMIWALDYDDFNDICGKGSYPLLKTLNRYIRCLNFSDYSTNY